jgi:hypothetical protein
MLLWPKSKHLIGERTKIKRLFNLTPSTPLP